MCCCSWLLLCESSRYHCLSQEICQTSKEAYSIFNNFVSPPRSVRDKLQSILTPCQQHRISGRSNSITSKYHFETLLLCKPSLLGEKTDIFVAMSLYENYFVRPQDSTVVYMPRTLSDSRYGSLYYKRFFRFSSSCILFIWKLLSQKSRSFIVWKWFYFLWELLLIIFGNGLFSFGNWPWLSFGRD